MYVIYKPWKNSEAWKMGFFFTERNSNDNLNGWLSKVISKFMSMIIKMDSWTKWNLLEVKCSAFSVISREYFFYCKLLESGGTIYYGSFEFPENNILLHDDHLYFYCKYNAEDSNWADIQSSSILDLFSQLVTFRLSIVYFHIEIFFYSLIFFKKSQ